MRILDLRKRWPQLPARWWNSALPIRVALLAIAATMVVPQIVFGVLMLLRYGASEIERAEFELVAASNGVSRAIENKFVLVESTLNILASSPPLQSGNLADYDRLLRRAAVVTGRAFDLSDRAGRIIISTRVAAGGGDTHVDGSQTFRAAFPG